MRRIPALKYEVCDQLELVIFDGEEKDGVTEANVCYVEDGMMREKTKVKIYEEDGKYYFDLDEQIYDIKQFDQCTIEINDDNTCTFKEA